MQTEETDPKPKTEPVIDDPSKGALEDIELPPYPGDPAYPPGGGGLQAPDHWDIPVSGVDPRDKKKLKP